jgi:hypothetical protein
MHVIHASCLVCGQVTQVVCVLCGTGLQLCHACLTLMVSALTQEEESS